MNLKYLLLVVVVFLISGCKDIVKIDGNSEVYTNSTYKYKAITKSEKIDSFDSYKWSITPKNSAELTNADKAEVEIKVLKEGKYKLHLIAKDNHKVFSTKMTIEAIKPIYIDGFLLPHAVDEILNNSTLLGIDANDNGIRDDVERWILLDKEIYYGNSKIERALAMNKARTSQMPLADPTNKDDKVHKAITDVIDCTIYYIRIKNKGAKSHLGDIIREMQDKTYNTKERLKTYYKYDSTLAGRVFSLTPLRLTHTKCDADTYTLIQEQ